MSERKIRRLAARRKSALALTTGALLVAATPATAANLVVTTNADSGAGSLRDAIEASNASPEADRITFAGVTSPITLESDLAQISGSVDIVGPGAGALTIDGAGAFKVLDTSYTYASDSNKISGITITNSLGSAIAAGRGELVVSDAVIKDGTGGAINILPGGRARIERSVVSGFVSANASNAPIFGQGAQVTVSGSTISDNKGGLIAGAVGAVSGDIKVENSTITGNEGNVGGGVTDYLGQGAEIESSTITGNSAQLGGGVTSIASAPTVLHNSIVAGNKGPLYVDRDVFSLQGTPVQASFSVIGIDPGPTSMTTTVPGSNKVSVNPELAPLASNGGSTQTQAIGISSPAFNAGDPASFPATDQRGVSRPQDKAPDIGAFELEDPLAPTVDLTKPKAKFKAKKKAKVKLEFTADEPATFECSLEGGKSSQAKFKTCTSPTVLNLKGKAKKGKKYTFSVRATDPAGHVSDKASATFKVIKKKAGKKK
ncbi:MAG: right-handed parallel beta-helix repeat-containing protein [Solirubrobacterales bacterium]